MKVRNGFVSNSSSSSFIVGLNKPVEEYTIESFMQEYEIKQEDSPYAEQLFKDLKDVNTQIKHLIDENDDILEVYLDVPLINSEDADEIIAKLRKYGKDLIKQYISKKYTKNLYKVIYADDCGQFECDMEHYFMPHFKGTIFEQSHH